MNTVHQFGTAKGMALGLLRQVFDVDVAMNNRALKLLLRCRAHQPNTVFQRDAGCLNNARQNIRLDQMQQLLHGQRIRTTQEFLLSYVPPLGHDHHHRMLP